MWIATGLLAVVAVLGGITKAFVSKERLAAVGLILPAAVGIAPVLVPVTAVC